MKFQFVGGAYTSRSLDASAQQTINLFLEKDPESDNGMILYGCPGSITEVTLAAAAVVRQAFTYDNVCYFVSGNKFYSMTTGNSVTERGTLTTSTGYVSIQTNGLILLIVDGTDGYTYTIATTTFATIADPDFPANPTASAVLDTIFVVIDSGTQAFYISTDGLAWGAADFASAESAPDDLLGVITDHQELILGGVDNTEIWYNSGDATFTFSRRAVIETGIAGPAAMCKADNSVFFLGNDGVIWRLNAYNPVRISTHHIEYAIGGYDRSDCIMWAQKEEGHVFIWCQFPTGDETWVYDVASNAWHKRAYRNTSTGVLHRHRANCYVKFNNKHLVGSYLAGKVYKLSLSIYDDDGDPLPAIRVCKSIGGKRAGRTVRHNYLVIDLEPGVGLDSGQGTDPQIMLKWSDDGGHTYGDSVWQDMGVKNDYTAMARWDCLGSVRPPADRVYWAQISDPVKRVITGAILSTS